MLPFFLLSFFPSFILSILRYFIYILLSKVLKYRLNVVKDNLKKAFPDNTQEQNNAVAKSYYLHLSQLLIDFIKGTTIGSKELKKQVVLHSIPLFEDYYNKNQSIILLMGHIGNWEKIGLISNHLIPQQSVIIYKKLNQPFFEYIFKKYRERLGAQMVEMNNTNVFLKNIHLSNSAITMLSDQSPSSIKRATWCNFLNQQTAFLSGAEIISKKYNLPVLYLDVNISNSGIYNIYPKVIHDTNKEIICENIIETYAKELDASIRKNTSFWLWSHRRWKHKIQ